MIVGVDLDDVVADYVGACIRRYGWPVVWSHSLWEMWPTVNWDAHFEHDRHASFLIGLQPIHGAREGVSAIAEEHHVFYFTASTELSKSVRKLWLRIHGFPDLPMICTDGFDEKARLVKQHRIDAIIEDLPSVLEAAHEAGVLTVTYNAPWNYGIRFGKRAYSWSEAGRYLLALGKG